MMSSDDRTSSSSSGSSPWDIENFNIGVKLGKGGFGVVHKCEHKKTKALFALKVLFKAELIESGVLAQLLKEVEVQSTLRHKYILRLRGVSQDSRRVYLYTDVCAHGTLYAHIKRVARFPEDIAGKYTRQLLNALCYLHSKQLVHRDIKPENLLLSSSGDLVLADFGWSTQIGEDGRITVCGTPEYLAPEMLQREIYTEKVDCWAAGVLLYELLCGRSPFIAFDQEEMCRKIVSCAYTVPDFVSEGPKDFISKALRKNAEKRYSSGELFMHAWIQECNEDFMPIVDYQHPPPVSAVASVSVLASSVLPKSLLVEGEVQVEAEGEVENKENNAGPVI